MKENRILKIIVGILIVAVGIFLVGDIILFFLELTGDGIINAATIIRWVITGAIVALLGYWFDSIGGKGKSGATKADKPPKSAESEDYYDEGIKYYETGKYAEAVSRYTKAIEAGFSGVDVYLDRGVAYYEMGEHSAAIADFGHVIKLNPSNADAYINRAMAHAEKGDYAEAISDYSVGIKLNPDDAGAYYNRGAAYEKNGDENKAESDYDRAADLGYKA